MPAPDLRGRGAAGVGCVPSMQDDDSNRKVEHIRMDASLGIAGSVLASGLPAMVDDAYNVRR